MIIRATSRGYREGLVKPEYHNSLGAVFQSKLLLSRSDQPNFLCLALLVMVYALKYEEFIEDVWNELCHEKTGLLSVVVLSRNYLSIALG